MTELARYSERESRIAQVMAEAELDENGRLVPRAQRQVAPPIERHAPKDSSPERVERFHKTRRVLACTAIYIAPLIGVAQVGDAAFSHQPISEVNLVVDANHFGAGMVELYNNVSGVLTTVNRLTGGNK